MPHAELPVTWTALRLPKQGCTDAECEDAWAADPATRRCAVADGASESAFAGLWARLLVEGFLAAARPGDFWSWLDEPRNRWNAEVTGLELPWYLEEKRKQGAFAALLGVGVRLPQPERPGRWKALAVGDCCLMQVRGSELVRRFPIEKASDFGGDPLLLGSRGRTLPKVEQASGELLPGDRLYLMTDALAQWFLQSHEGGGQPWEAIATVLSAERPDEAFAAWVEELRASNTMRDDDVTLLTMTAGETPQEKSP